MKKIIFYDPDITGHHCEYLHHPASFIVNQQDVAGVIVCNAKIGNQLKHIYGVRSSLLEIVCIDDDLQQLIDQAKNLWQRGRADADCFAHYMQKLKPDLAIALHANPMQPFLNSRYFRRSKIPVRGILFDPFPLAERLGRQNKTWRWRLTALRKVCQVRWFSMNRCIDKMFILNDEKVAAFFNSISGKPSLFEAIPDPLPLHLQEVEATRQPARLEGRRQLLFIGSINRRKGLLETLRALERMPDSMKAKVHLRVVGRFLDSTLRDEAVAKVDTLVENGYSIELCEGWVSDEQFALEMQQCDLVLAPYVGFHGSSGVIGHAAFLAKPLLATCDGLVGEIVSERCLGEVVQTRDPDLYAAVITSLLERKWDRETPQAKYADEMCSKAFMKQLISE